MPFVSKSQQRYMFAKHPKIALRWAKETSSIKSLPEKKKKSHKQLTNQLGRAFKGKK